MPNDQGVQPSSAQIEDDYRGAQQLQKVKRRLRRRVVRLRILAYAFLTFVILVLVGLIAVFAFANYITRLISPPETAASQYAKLMDDRKRLGEQLDAVNRKQQEILNEGVILGPYNEKIAKIKAEYMPLEENILRNCPKATLNDYKHLPEDAPFFGWDDRMMTVTDLDAGGYGFGLPSGKLASFENLDLANECKNHFVEHKNEIIQSTKEFDAINREKIKTKQRKFQKQSFGDYATNPPEGSAKSG